MLHNIMSELLLFTFLFACLMFTLKENGIPIFLETLIHTTNETN